MDLRDTGEITSAQKQRQLETLRGVLNSYQKGPIGRNELCGHPALRFMRDSIRQRLSDLRNEGYSVDFNRSTKTFDWKGVIADNQLFLV